MNVQLSVSIDNDKVDDLVGKAVKHGFKRERPDLKWSNREKKNAVRWYLKRMVIDAID